MYWNVIHKFLSGQCTPAERKKVEQWLKEDPDRSVFMRSMQKIWDVNPKKEGTVDVEEAWRRFQNEQMKPKTPPKLPNIKPVTNSKKRVHASQVPWYQQTPIYAAAAAVLLLVVVFLVARIHLENSTEVTYQHIVTGMGEKTSLELSDGTHLMLNAESSLKIPSNYGKKDRSLYLEGEAFFTVEHETSKPFKVYTGGVYTLDIGTQFNIKAFPGDTSIAVVVAEGQVEVGNAKDKKKKPVRASSHEQVVISNTGKTQINNVTDLSDYTGWTQGTLVFENTLFKDVVKQLERWYGIKCRVKNNILLDHKLTATFEQEPLSNVLKLISKSMAINADIKGQTVVFSVHQTVNH